MATSCECGNEYSGPINGGEFVDQLTGCYILMKNSALFYFECLKDHYGSEVKDIIWLLVLRKIIVVYSENTNETHSR